eukprot:2187585-Pyramimonas_sp.AAC.1
MSLARIMACIVHQLPSFKSTAHYGSQLEPHLSGLRQMSDTFPAAPSSRLLSSSAPSYNYTMLVRQ